MTAHRIKADPRLGIGIDYGTSNSTAALFDGRTVHLLRLECEAPVMPSATCVNRDFTVQTGQAAIDQYIASNSGRTVELSAEVLGEGRTTTGQIGDRGLPEEARTETIYGHSLVDRGQQSRLFRGIKRLLGNGGVQRLRVFERPFRLVALITPLLLRIHHSLLRLHSSQSLPDDDCSHACIGHPIHFEGTDTDTAGNARALRQLAEACGHAGFHRQSFYPEPVAAALSYLHKHPQAAEQVLLAVDFGGGTLDICVLARSQGRFRVLTTHGTGLGGDHIDRLLFRELVFPLLGKGERWRRVGEDQDIETLFPFEDYEELLLNWAVGYLLNQNRYTSPLLQRIEYGDAAALKFRRLYDLIKNNYSYLVFQGIRQLKTQLSVHLSARLDIPDLDIEMEVSRARFEQLISGLLARVERVVEEALDKAQLGCQQIDLVIRTGGSSLIPAVKQLLTDKFPQKVIEHDPFTSVAAGLAIAEYQQLARARIEDSATGMGQPLSGS